MIIEMKPIGIIHSPFKEKAGMPIVKLINIHDNFIEIENVDIIDGTPLLDIKPYIGSIDSINSSITGWMDGKETNLRNSVSDSRFE